MRDRRLVAGGPDGAPYYGRARIIAGILCVTAGIFLSVVDSISRDFEVNIVVLGILLGTGLLFLGVEGGRRLLGGP